MKLISGKNGSGINNLKTFPHSLYYNYHPPFLKMLEHPKTMIHM